MSVETSAALSIEADQVQYVSPEGQVFRMSLGEVVSLVQSRFLEERTGWLPREVCAAFRRGRHVVWVGEFAPAVYPLRWISEDSPAPFGPGTKYELRSIALPYVIVFAVFDSGTLLGANECYFRTAPPASTDDELLFPALLNVSKFPQVGGEKKPLAWICTQHLNFRALAREQDLQRRMTLGWRLLCETLFDHGFNHSSETHEGASWWGESRGVDERIGTIERWEQSSRENPLFALDVPFLKTGRTVTQIVDRIFDNLGASRRTLSADDLARLIANHFNAPRRPR